MITAIVGASTAIVLAILGATWALASRLGKMEISASVLQVRVDGIAEDVKELKQAVGRGLTYEAR